MSNKFEAVQVKKRFWMERLRNEMGLSRRQTAFKIGGISWQHYNDIEAGRRNPSFELSMKLAEFFGAPVTLFFEDRTKWKKVE